MTTTVDAHELDALRRQATDLTLAADAAERAYERAAWIAYATIFIAIPLVVVTFRLHMQPWQYFLAGALFVAGALVIQAADIAAFAKRDKALDAVRRAQEAGAVARPSLPGAL